MGKRKTSLRRQTPGSTSTSSRANRGAQASQGMDAQVEEEEWKVSRVVGKRRVKGRVEYQLEWVGWDEPSWEPAKNLNCSDLIEAYEESNGNENGKDGKDFIVKKVVGKREVDGRVEYRLEWEGWRQTSWEPEGNLSCPELIQAFEERQQASTGVKKRGRPRNGQKGDEKREDDAELQENEQDFQYLLKVDPALKPLKVVGASKRDGVLYLLMKWKNQKDANFVVASLVNSRWPKLVIDHYEDSIRWQA